MLGQLSPAARGAATGLRNSSVRRMRSANSAGTATSLLRRSDLEDKATARQLLVAARLKHVEKVLRCGVASALGRCDIRDGVRCCGSRRVVHRDRLGAVLNARRRRSGAAGLVKQVHYEACMAARCIGKC